MKSNLEIFFYLKMLLSKNQTDSVQQQTGILAKPDLITFITKNKIVIFGTMGVLLLTILLLTMLKI